MPLSQGPATIASASGCSECFSAGATSLSRSSSLLPSMAKTSVREGSPSVTAMITTIDLDGSMVDHGAMKAYSVDLRQKVVEAVEQRGTSKSEAARLFGISLSSVKRYT